MPIRNDVMTCLRERLLNDSEAGPVFENEEAYLDWLLGSSAEGAAGFLNDPAAALNRSISGASKDEGHNGVELSTDEARQIRHYVSKTGLSGLSSRMTSGSVAMLMASVTFLGPILADGGGY